MLGRNCYKTAASGSGVVRDANATCASGTVAFGFDPSNPLANYFYVGFDGMTVSNLILLFAKTSQVGPAAGRRLNFPSLLFIFYSLILFCATVLRRRHRRCWGFCRVRWRRADSAR